MAYAARLRRLRADINAAVDIENRLGGKAQKSKSDAEPTPLADLLEEALDACKAERKRKREDDDGLVGDGELLHLTRHTHNYALYPYRKFLHYVPRVVNVVSLAEAVPAPGSNVTLPLDVRTIASRCSGAGGALSLTRGLAGGRRSGATGRWRHAAAPAAARRASVAPSSPTARDA